MFDGALRPAGWPTHQLHALRVGHANVRVPDVGLLVMGDGALCSAGSVVDPLLHS